MIWKNTEESYGIIARILHWMVAFCVLGLLALGLYMTDQDISPFVFKLYFWHKSFGILVLSLMFVRLFWRLMNKTPRPLLSHRLWEKKMARFIQIFFYFSLMAMPMVGWVMSSAKNYPVHVFGLFTLPKIVEKNEALAEQAAFTHKILAYLLIGAIVLHVAGALKHHFIDRDQTMKRMLFLSVFLVFLCCATPLLASDVTQWKIEEKESALFFDATQIGADFTGEFKSFRGDIFFDTERLEKSHVRIIIDMGSFDTKDKDRDAQISGVDWFFIESFPESIFEATDFKKINTNQYVANGSLKIKDTVLPVKLPFSLRFLKNKAGKRIAKMEGTLLLKRLDFGIGQSWTDEKMVGNQVKVRVSLVAREISLPD